MTHRSLLALALVLAMACASHAQPAAWEQPAAKKDARRVLKAIQDVMVSSERNDAGPALKAVGDGSWVVRLVAAVRLEVLGLDRGVSVALKKNARPGAPPLGGNDPALRAARTFAQGLEVDPAPVAAPPPSEVMKIVTSVVSERIKHGPETPLAKQGLLEGLLPFAASVDEPGKAWLAGRVLRMTDSRQALEDLGAKTLKKAVGKDGARVYAWYKGNARYLYFHPKGKQFLLDEKARQAKTPSAEYRLAHPWGEEEGPSARLPTERRQ